jgi:biopolymer transport protein ExbD
LRRRTEGDEQIHVDLTNLIDPLFLLVAVLILIMPEASSMRVRADLTNITAGDAPGSDDKNLPIVEFDSEGRLSYDGQSVTREDLTHRLKLLPANSSVMLAGDQNASYGAGLEIRHLLQQAGIGVREVVDGAE